MAQLSSPNKSSSSSWPLCPTVTEDEDEEDEEDEEEEEEEEEEEAGLWAEKKDDLLAFADAAFGLNGSLRAW